ncbi:MAG: winged helix family transcriptional regulator [Actinobacteria bacterium]|nr:winged helix family transcriptional regulator [Actinomycetota bacterium]NCV36469.1 winged helix family transcriptional regulator [Actinomycetota bacterium]NCV80502.1 winged helix family transcriptional regulator [Actinomycetota bacterium]NCV97929.1 winged helix family transcriptional regulator [Actinomycetota bacterium]NCW28830.1 winged helix family transcriptional regulator [Actinomycetota bacterium]
MTTAIKKQTEAKGFALYVGITEQQAQEVGLTLAEVATALKTKLAELIPTAASETYAALAIAPEETSGRPLDITRLALGEPRAVRAAKPQPEEVEAAKGVVVDLSRKKVFVDGTHAQLTCKEYELLAFLIEREGQTVSRATIASISERCGEATPNFRTIDVHVRRLRSKLGLYEDIIRTARGQGYRFDAHPDVLIEKL